jgi:hypothetical protein
MTADRHFTHHVDGCVVQPQTFHFLVDHRLVRVLDPARKSDASGNGHVISDRGRELLQATAAAHVARTATASVAGLPPESCAQCGKTISARARANVFGDRVVCTPCWNKLSAAAADDQRKRGLASEAQVKYARDLGLALPANATWLEMHDMLSRHLDYDDDRVAPEWLRNLATRYGVTAVTRFSGHRQRIGACDRDVPAARDSRNRSGHLGRPERCRFPRSERHWCEVRYEATVADGEHQARRALTTLGVGWDQRVLDSKRSPSQFTPARSAVGKTTLRCSSRP